jgi:FAD/FMN-containing dehydrogenase
MNTTIIYPNFVTSDGRNVPVFSYQGGATWAQVESSAGGSGLVVVGSRCSSVGVGGFSTGGSIGFLAGAYGYAIDRLVALKVVLPSGDVVNATRQNEYADLFWALQGGGGQFGIVTTFYQEALPEPTEASIGVYVCPT